MATTCSSKRSIFGGTNLVLVLAWMVCGPIQTPCHAEKPPTKKVSLPPTSKVSFPAAQNLPSFGAIDWKAEEIPFVPDGPGAGISGAAMVVLNGKIYIAGGFIPAGDETDDKQSRRTSRWTFCYDPQQGKLPKFLTLPSGGDTSYPGLFWLDNHLWISYYSSHEKNPVSIWPRFCSPTPRVTTRP